MVAYDVVLGDGSLVHATVDNEYSDLFKCLPWSHGSLGFLVALELRIIPVKPYIHMQYMPVSGKDHSSEFHIVGNDRRLYISEHISCLMTKSMH